jgi:hypothetical protein
VAETMIEAFLVQEENREVSHLAFWIKQVDQSSREKTLHLLCWSLEHKKLLASMVSIAFQLMFTK